ncbi:methyltransferase [Microbacterium mitrae]|uniref:Methyltransferase n=1 Tax=Microbacterium mitrae TaxID=664640 RepID=A0A5C8HKU9_9MICO|nr:methyltransferase [Microbacterium mitrae]TXK03474.1 methyltransferase [Microbacterium mitrae]
MHIHADATLIAALATDLRDARFTSESIRAAWGVAADNAFARGTRVPALRALKNRTDATAVLARFFVLGVAQPSSDLAAALPTLGLDGLHTLGLVAGADLSTPTVLIRPQSFVDEAGAGEWWVASDLDETALGGALPDDHVVGVGGASLTLAALQVPTPARSVFDLGTGCGIQALRARRHAERVVATDISENALAFARFNALLNGVTDIDVRAGSLFEPVAGETFDRIVSNPPFVITPRRDDVPAYEYRDGGMQGDDLVAAVFAGVGEHLAPGGIAQFLGNWEYRWGTDGLDRVRAWVENSPVPLDAWVIEREQLDPAEYAALWIRDGGTVQGTAAHEQLLDAWLDDFSHRNVTAIGFGYVLLRRPLDGEPTLRRFERVTTPIPAEGTIGAHLADMLAAHDATVALSDDELAALHLITAPDVTEKRHYLPGAEDPTVIELNQGSGFGRALSVDPDLAALVGACDGELSVQQINDAIAELMELDATSLRADLLPRVRELIMTGFLRLAV